MMERVTAESTSRTQEPGRLTRRPGFRIGVVVAVALVAAFVVWLLVRRNGSSPTKAASVRAGAVPVSPAVLGALARSSRSPIYWAGPRASFTYELTRTADGRVFIRYLPHGVAVGAVEPYLTVGSYPVANAFAITSTLASRSGAVRVPVPRGGVGFYNASSPTNVYLAFPNTNEQVEVYDPVAADARRLVVSGQIAAVSTASGSSGIATSATSVEQLTALSATLGHPIYWVGRRSAVTYELTRAPGGHVFVRYLPPGAAIGTDRPYLTVGTYPVKGAFALTEELSKASTSVPVEPGSGGIAFYSKARPTNVYVAYPGTDLQIEVYDPAPGAARGLVTAGRVVPVG
jgi:hypothetical protein